MATMVETGSGAVDALTAAAGADAVLTDAATRDFFAHDVYSTGRQPLAVLRPATVEQLARGVAAATGQGLAIVPRGGGMSYTGGYIYSDGDFVLVDTAALDAIIAINPVDMTVTVEAGCTWAKLHDTLKPMGLRCPSWGTLSGLRAAVGGGMSQNGTFWGARNGSVVDSALSFDVVLADGRIVSTGSDFFRPFGPDITGLFAADTGAFGVKARVTLRLVREATAFAYGSFSLPDHAGLLGSMSEIAREGLAAESFAFDPYLQSQRMKRDSLAKDAKSLLNMMKSQGSAWKALKEGAKVVTAGRSFLKDVPFSLHTIAEGRHSQAVDAEMAEIGKIVAAYGGTAIENSIPKILRANPFPPPNSMLGPDGERWVPVHGFLPHSRLVEAWERIEALYAENADAMTRLDVNAGAMLAAVSRSACLIEPVFFWPDAMNPLHRAAVEPDHLKKLKGFPEGPEARALVAELRAGIIAIFRSLEATHLQIARTYPLKASLDPAAWDILSAVKRAVDPKGLMNPGSLGLE
ncbi:FAD-binding oxidoreductase [Blastomonas fulva]|uniref:FAD-binding oxidoreductase n=1 Tax=Blastomonas fulva TaxID=1550728 RepID=UPI0025A4BF2A|nr:FAD-binding oxidoreductase [Blastomonas fulva]MDM7966124.1 FAD-binding oxidoreductase [Blastomonas fulva]